MRQTRLWLPLLLLLLLAAVQPADMADEADDPTNIVNEQIAAVGSVSTSTSDADTLSWLNDMDEVLTRVALGALPGLPPNAFTALDMLNSSVATTERLERSPAVVRGVLRLVPSLWAMAFWYVPLNEWSPPFMGVFSRSVAAAKHSDELYDSAVNATARVVRFTKDSVFFDGEDHGDAIQPPSDEYMALLPSLLAQTSRRAGWRISETQLRAFMDRQLHSKLDGMDLTVAFPTFVDTSVFWADDATKIKALVSQRAPHA